MRELKIKKVLALLIITIVLTASFAYLAWSPDLTYDTVLENGSLITQDDYIISRDSTTYYSRHGRTGAISYSSTNVSDVVNDSINALPDTSQQSGGSIHFTSGVFTFTHSLVINDNNTNLYGAGRDNTKLELAASADCSLILVNPAVQTNFISIRDLTLDGNKNTQTASATSHGIEVDGNVGDVTFSDLYIDDFLNYTISVIPDSIVWNLWITENLLEGSNAGGIFLDATVQTGDNIDFVHITGNYIHGNGYGINIYGNLTRDINIEENIIKMNDYHGIYLQGSRWTNIIGNHVNDNSFDTAYTYDGIYLCAYDGNEALYHTINSNTIGNQGLTGMQRYGINIEDSSDALTIVGNMLENNNNASVIINAGAGVTSEIAENVGFRTTYEGTATISASTNVTQAHYLGATPVIVNVTPQSDYSGVWWVTNVNITHFIIHADQSVTCTFFWLARYHPT